METVTDVVRRKWIRPFSGGTVLCETTGFRLAARQSLSHNASVQVLGHQGRTLALVTDDVAAQPEIRDATDQASFREAIANVGIEMNGPDHLFFLPSEKKLELYRSANAPHVRQLTKDDAAAFSEFEDSASEQDRDDAYVELGHWVVFGAFDGGSLIAAGSAYPFDNEPLADFGVLTLCNYRGQGHATEIVSAMARYALARGFEPQYRCQLDNLGSIALARKTGFVELGTWDIALSNQLS